MFINMAERSGNKDAKNDNKNNGMHSNEFDKGRSFMLGVAAARCVNSSIYLLVIPN